MQPLKGLQLSAIMTFGTLAIAVLSANIWWKEQSRLARQVEQLNWQLYITAA